MQVNLNTNVDQSRPNFKASLANDKLTQQIATRFAKNSPCGSLALDMALKDIPVKTKVFLKEVKIYGYIDKYQAKVQDKVIDLGDRPTLAAFDLLEKICDGKIFATDIRPKLSYREYLAQARSYVAKIKEEGEANIKNLYLQINQLQGQIDTLKSQISMQENINEQKVIEIATNKLLSK